VVRAGFGLRFARFAAFCKRLWHHGTRAVNPRELGLAKTKEERMKYTTGNRFDGVAAEDDVVGIRVQNDIAGGVKLYIDVNGVTFLRIGQIKQQIEVKDEADGGDDCCPRCETRDPQGSASPSRLPYLLF
jgi:hypothetical protein